jgi:5-methylcytosine-specific restriction endonuclease McrA
MNKKLTIELVPSKVWFTNVRALLKRREWDLVRNACYEKAGHVCEICGDVGTNQGFRHKVECHEIWEYNDVTRVQKLTGFISLCPRCHKVKHAGLTISQGNALLVVNHMMAVNGTDLWETQKEIEDAFKQFKERSSQGWHTNFEYLHEFMNQHGIKLEFNPSFR